MPWRVLSSSGSTATVWIPVQVTLAARQPPAEAPRSSSGRQISNSISTAYDWLVVAGARAQYKGTFLLTVIDGDQPGGGGLDKFRIKISDSAGVIYDNQIGADDSADPSTVIASGHIVIHK
jgi:hypothetical protein